MLLSTECAAALLFRYPSFIYGQLANILITTTMHCRRTVMARDLAREHNEFDGFQQCPHSKKQKDAITCVLRILTKLHLPRGKFGKIFSKKDLRSAKLNSRKNFAHHQDYIFSPHLQHNVNKGNREDKVKVKLIRRLSPSLHDHGLPSPRVECG